MDQRVHGVYRTLFDASFVFFLPNLLGSASAIEMENSFFGQLDTFYVHLGFCVHFMAFVSGGISFMDFFFSCAVGRRV
jgi:hypothetical protein